MCSIYGAATCKHHTAPYKLQIHTKLTYNYITDVLSMFFLFLIDLRVLLSVRMTVIGCASVRMNCIGLECCMSHCGWLRVL